MNLIDMWFRMTVPGYAKPVEKDDLGKLGGDDRFVPPPPNSRYQPDPWWYRW